MKHIPLGILLAFSVRYLILPLNLEGALALAALAALVAYFRHLDSVEANRVEDEKLKALNDKIDSQYAKIDKQIADIDAMKSTVTGLRLNQTMIKK